MRFGLGLILSCCLATAPIASASAETGCAPGGRIVAKLKGVYRAERKFRFARSNLERQVDAGLQCAIAHKGSSMKDCRSKLTSVLTRTSSLINAGRTLAKAKYKFQITEAAVDSCQAAGV
jgi:hypothetical protein